MWDLKRVRERSGPESFRSQARLPKNAGHATQLQHDRNLAKQEDTLILPTILSIKTSVSL